MNDSDVEYLRSWLGKSRVDEDLISSRHSRLLAATLEYKPTGQICDGEVLPPLWHWIYFLEGVPAGELGADGHPVRGQFMPPVPLPNRMWAGGRVSFIAPVIIGTSVRKESSILKIDYKQGRSGELVFVTVLHEVKTIEGELLIQEEQDIVYKGSASGAANQPLKHSGQHGKTYTPDSTMLFRYSALTFNGHRIHYDVDYCRQKEGYENLVIHGPLNATMLAGYAEEISGRRLHKFSYRGLAPTLLGNSITLHATVEDELITLAATLNDDTVCMQAEASVKTPEN